MDKDVQALAAEVTAAMRKPVQTQAPDPLEQALTRGIIPGIRGTVTITGTDQHGNLVSQQVGGFFGFTDQEKYEMELAARYHRCCNEFDRSVCTARSPHTGEPIPVTSWELGMVNRNAYQQIQALARYENISESKLRQIIRRWPPGRNYFFTEKKRHGTT